MALTLLLWDAPNIDMTLSGILNKRPTTEQRPRFDVLGKWLVHRAREADPKATVEACVFVNVPQTSENGPLLGWVKVLLSNGFRVFAKPRTTSDSDIDDDMLEHLHLRADDVREVIIASNDAEAFRTPLETFVGAGARATVLGFNEYLGGYSGSGLIDLIDLESIRDLFPMALPERIRFDALPDEGRWFEPSGSLLTLLHPPADR